MPATESPISAESQGSKLARIAAWVLTAAIVVLSLVPPTLRPETSAPHSLEHFTIYAATGFAFGLGYKHRHDLLAILLVISTGCIEIAQLFVPGRHARLSDFIVDTIAACMGLVFASLLSLARSRLPDFPTRREFH
jgi:VanZ family protein